MTQHEHIKYFQYCGGNAWIENVFCVDVLRGTLINNKQAAKYNENIKVGFGINNCLRKPALAYCGERKARPIPIGPPHPIYYNHYRIARKVF